MKTFAYFICLFFLLTGVAKAQSPQILEGKLLLKPWSKTIESYCAGGSDYFVLEISPQENVILKTTESQMKQMQKLQNAQVKIEGSYVKEEKKHENPMEQHPVGMNECTVFRVKKVKRIKQKA